MSQDPLHPRPRIALVLSGGGARGAYEAGVLSYLFDHVYPKLPPGFEFDLVSGTSVGAIHAGFVAASADLDPATRSRMLIETWEGMALDRVMQVSAGDVLGVPLRAAGVGALMRGGRSEAPELIGGLVDIAPLERLVEERIPWAGLRGNLAAGRPGALCVACTDIHNGHVTVFIDGQLTDTTAWRNDPYAHAISAEITARHVRASAAIPFLFPAVRIGDSYYLDGGLRVNTPLSPALRLQADRALVIGLKTEPLKQKPSRDAEDAITKPAFLLGKMLNVLILDQLEHEIRRVETINALLGGAARALGSNCIASINQAIEQERGIRYRPVTLEVVRPSRDLGQVAAEARRHRSHASRSRGVLPQFLARLALRGVPEDEADLFSYLYFDASFTEPLVELGRADAQESESAILELLSAPAAGGEA